MSSIDLGFAQQIDFKWKLKNKYFPSKIGGKPVFLELRSIPNSNDLKCVKCEEMLRFLLQIYAPIESNTNAFHRTLFVFCCLNKDCNQFKVFRSQLSRNNGYYSSDPPNYEFDDESYDPKPEQFGHKLCIVCGFDATKKCSKCLEVSYCSKQHQLVDWREGNHKHKCGSTDLQIIDVFHNSALFPELDLIIGDNQSSDDSDSENDDNDSEVEAKELQKYNELIENRCPEYQTKDFDKYEENVSEDQKVFNRFKRISSGEVIRYCSYDNDSQQEVEPLWVSIENKPNLPIPNCQYCQSERRFEFQVMPQLLTKIVGSDQPLDWGTLLVYTCANSCSSDAVNGYKEEYIWNQTIS